MPPIALTIAGSDPSGGAGIQADLKTFHQHGVYGMAAITLLTVQNTRSVEAVHLIDPNIVLQQIKVVLSDIPPGAAKSGALGGPEIADAVSMAAEKFEFPFVVDPVMISKHGQALLDDEGKRVLRRQLVPLAYLIMPNVPEAQELSELEIFDVASMEKAAVSISKLGAKNVLVKGGHLGGEATDVLYCDKQLYRFPAPRIDSSNTHGTGCVYSAAVTAQLARKNGLLDAVKIAKEYIARAIETAPGLGGGVGPVNIFAGIG